jgi:hypothetical protein
MIKEKSSTAAENRNELCVRAEGPKDALCSRKKWIPAGNRTR